MDRPREVGELVPMLRGKSAASMMSLAARMGFLIAASIAATALIAVFFGERFSGRAIFGFVMVVIFLLFTATGVVHTTGKVKEAREFHAGYTTIMRAHRGVDQIDPDTGRVLRSAGEPFLTKDQYESRVARVRDAQSGSGSVGGGS